MTPFKAQNRVKKIKKLIETHSKEFALDMIEDLIKHKDRTYMEVIEIALDCNFKEEGNDKKTEIV